MGSTIFFSWQSDRPPLTGRNLIERALRDAVKRIAAEATVEEAPRGELLIDRDTLNTPGSPPIFETILQKIEAAIIFVPDLTFVGLRGNGTPVPNPNVLIEYGYALNQHGHERIIGVMNAAYGEPTRENMPFNLGHIRFPLQYTLHEKADEEERKTARVALSKKFEEAIKTIFASDDFKASTQAKVSAAQRTALDEADDYANEVEYQNAIKLLGYGEGLARVHANVRNLFVKIEDHCVKVSERLRIPLEFEAGSWNERAQENFCAIRGGGFSMSVGWHQPYAGTDRDAFLFNILWERQLIFRRDGPRMHLNPPEKVKTKYFLPWLSRYSEVGWADKKTDMRDANFISDSELVDAFFSDFIKLLRNHSR